tara:strand:- start:536 stop:1261 length:726 start_codon:yes stop_codon:yes gene_type:complete
MILTQADNIKIGSDDVTAVRLGSDYLFQVTADLSVLQYGFHNGLNGYLVAAVSTSFEESTRVSSMIGLLTIPSTFNGLPVVGTNTNAFNGANRLLNVVIPDSVTSIGNSSFFECRDLESVTMSSNLTLISDSAFNGCEQLTSITIPDGVTSFGVNTFRNCGRLSSINIPSSVTSIGASCFRDCQSLSRINCFATTPPTMGNAAFSNIAFDTNGFRSIHVPTSASSAYGNVFAGLTVVADLS